MEINIRLDKEQRQAVVKLLERLLADEFVLYVKTRNYHWNVTGSHFHALHKFFEDQYDDLAEFIDETAERIRSLGFESPGSMSAFLKDTRLQECTAAHLDDHSMLKNLLLDHEALIAYLRVDLDICAEDHNDMGTSDFLTGLMEKHEKMAWMLRAHLR
ncbi:MAG: DNA starvation/stationary phase protection protein [Candidatus Caenarcaniphilales bacterium]|nr:DNA starvation/stationary phase protection protein [Candidatus Caenarcaniphilales bacterium]